MKIRKISHSNILRISIVTLIFILIFLNVNGNQMNSSLIAFNTLNSSSDAEENNLDINYLQNIHNQYTSGITSNNSDNAFIQYIFFISFPLTIEFSIILKKKNSKIVESVDVNNYIPDLNNVEKSILNIVQEFMSKNRTCNKDSLINYINAVFGNSDINLSKKGIIMILNSLFEMNIIVEGSKLLKTDVLLNPNRKKIYDYVLRNPGDHFMEIVRNVKFSNYLVKWHLDTLERFSFIKKEKIENYDAYYNFNFNSEDIIITHFLSRNKSKQILSFISKNEGVTKYKISKELGMHQTTISKYVLKFEEFGLIYSKKYSNKVLYFLSN